MGGRNRRGDSVDQRGDSSLLKKHLHLPIVFNDHNFHMFDYLNYGLAGSHTQYSY